MNRFASILVALIAFAACSSSLSSVASADEGDVEGRLVFYSPTDGFRPAAGQYMDFQLRVDLGTGALQVDTASIVVELVYVGQVVATSRSTEWVWSDTSDPPHPPTFYIIDGDILIPLNPGSYILRARAESQDGSRTYFATVSVSND